MNALIRTSLQVKWFWSSAALWDRSNPLIHSQLKPLKVKYPPTPTMINLIRWANDRKWCHHSLLFLHHHLSKKGFLKLFLCPWEAGLTRCNPQRLPALPFRFAHHSHPRLPPSLPPLPSSSPPLSLHPAIIVNIDSVKHWASRLISVSAWISLSLSEGDYYCYYTKVTFSLANFPV